jgi:hypothetical protein
MKPTLFTCVESVAYIATTILVWIGIMKLLIYIGMRMEFTLFTFAILFAYTPIGIKYFFNWIKTNAEWQGSEL